MTSYLALAEAAWAWVLDHVGHDELGPTLPETAGASEPNPYPLGMHGGIGGLAHTLDRVRAVRPWTSEETSLAAAVAERLRLAVPDEECVWYFDGLVSHLEVLALLGESGVDTCVDRLLAMEPAAWEHVNDVTLGTGSLVHGALVAGSPELAAYGAALLMSEAEETPAGLNWQFKPRRHVPPDRLEDGRPVEMPNWSHGVAGIAGVLARAGALLGDPSLVDAARRGAEHFVSLADPDVRAGGGLAVSRRIPWKPDYDDLTWNWCHGPAGSLALFEALSDAGVPDVAGDPPSAWIERCLVALRTSGIPERRHPGFWDNDGRCCGTAGVGSAVLPYDPDFAAVLGDALVDRAYVEGDRAYWRFVEHRNPEPLLPAGLGWMQGAAGIAGFLFELAAARAEAHIRAESDR